MENEKTAVSKAGLVEENKQLKEQVEQLKKELADMVHLAQAIEGKDKEINALKQKVSEAKLRGEDELNKYKAQHQDELNKYRTQLQAKEQELQAKIKDGLLLDNLKINFEKLQKENKNLISLFNSYVNVYRSTLKALQGSLDNSIELEALIMEKANTKKEE